MPAHVLETWFHPTGGLAAQPTLLETREFDPASDPPSMYRFGEVDLLAASSSIVRRQGWTVYQVHVIDPDYAKPA